MSGPPGRPDPRNSKGSGRRDVLKLLGLAGVGAGGAVVLTNDDLNPLADDSDSDSSTTGTTDPDDPVAEAASKIEDAYQPVRAFPESVDLSYGSVETSTDDDRFSHVTAATTESGDGDRIRIDVTGGQPAEVASMLRSLWQTGTEQTTTRTVSGTSVEFVGGASETLGVAALLGTFDAGTTPAVLVARAREVASAVELTESFEAVLD